MHWKRLTGWNWLEPRLRFVLTESYRASANATGVLREGSTALWATYATGMSLPPETSQLRHYVCFHRMARTGSLLKFSAVSALQVGSSLSSALAARAKAIASFSRT